MRVSSYNTVVPVADGRHIMFHCYSGAVDVVDRRVVGYLEAVAAAGSTEAVDPAAHGLSGDDAATLAARGYLTERDHQEEVALVRRMGRAFHKGQSRGLGIVLIPTYDCNLRCRYCYERSLLRRGRRWLERTMTQEQVDRVFELVSGARHAQQIGYPARR